MPNGVPCRVTIGDYGVYTPEAARQKATEYLLKMSDGKNPNDEKEQRRQKASQERVNHQKIPTVIDAYRHYIEANEPYRVCRRLFYLS